jgi:hypothetical protein
MSITSPYVQQFSFCLAFHLNHQDIDFLAHRSRPLEWTPAVQESALADESFQP